MYFGIRNTNTKIVNKNVSFCPIFITVWYKLRVDNVSVKTKNNKTFQYVSVTKNKSSSDTVYGNRFVDKEINLKFPDVYKIHAIHQATVSGVTNDQMFDRCTVNDAADIKTGDIIQSGSLRAKIIFKNGTNLHIKLSLIHI